MYDVDIVTTGSHGNMNIIDRRIVIDFGVKAAAMKLHMNDIDVMLVSHRHGDHLSIPAIRAIRRSRPELLKNLYVNQDTFTAIRKADADAARLIHNVIDKDSTFVVTTREDSYTVKTFELVHDVENQGFILTKHSTGETLIHATDTSTMHYAPRAEYDVIMVEGNWDEERLFEHFDSDDPNLIFRASRNLRHLSVQSLADFIACNSKDSTIAYQLHASAEYGIDARLATPENLSRLLTQFTESGRV